MIPDLHRMKGGAAQLGARPGHPGPFGTWSADEDEEELPDLPPNMLTGLHALQPLPEELHVLNNALDAQEA